MPPILESLALNSRGELSPSTSTNTETLLSRRREGDGDDGDDGVGRGGGGGESSPGSAPWIAIGVIICLLILLAFVGCWGVRRRRVAMTARRERLQRDKRRYEIEMRSLGRLEGVEPPPDYVVTMLEQPVLVPVHLRESDYGERLVG